MTSNFNEIATLEAMYSASQKRLRARLAGLGVAASDVDDLRHEVFLVALKRRATLSNEAAAAAWLNQACEFVALAHRRKAYRRREVQTDAAEGDSSQLLGASEPEASSDRPSERLHQALAELNPLERDLLALHLAAEVPFRTLAELHGCDVKTVRKRFQAAAQRLRRILEAGQPRAIGPALPADVAAAITPWGDESHEVLPFRRWGCNEGVALGSIGNVLISSWRGAITPAALELLRQARDGLQRRAGARIACLGIIEASWPVPRFDERQLIFQALDFWRENCLAFSLFGAHPNLRLAEQIMRGLGFLMQTGYPLGASQDLTEAVGWLLAQRAVRGLGGGAEQLVAAARNMQRA
jgi:RNA polymerase sigma factor (sigma-70 family)